MTSVYPGALDSFATSRPSTNLLGPDVLDHADALNKIEAELGVNAGSGIVRSATLVVAASNATTAMKNVADYVCDGTADDVEINAAIAAIGSAGGRVLLSEGTFTIAAPILAQSKDRITIEGQGFSTQITPAAGFSAGAGVSGLVVIDGNGTQPTGYAQVKNLYLNGNNVGTYTAPIDGLFFRGYHGRIQNVYAYRCSGNGFHFMGYAGWDTYDTMVFACTSEQNWLNGFKNDATGSPDMHYVECVAMHNGDGSLNTGIDTVNIDTTTASSGWRLDGSSQQIVNCHAYSNNSAGIYNGGARTKIVNCKIENNRIGIDHPAGGSYVTIGNCNFLGGKGTTVSAHIRFNGASGNGFGSIHGCVFDAFSGGTALAQYGILLATGQTQNMVIVGNYFTGGWGTAAIQDSGGTGSFGQLISNNIGFVTENQGFFTTAASTTAYTFAHGCSYTPPKAEVTLTPLGNLGAVQYWVSAIDATNVTVTFSAQPTASVNVGWTVGRRGMR